MYDGAGGSNPSCSTNKIKLLGDIPKPKIRLKIASGNTLGNKLTLLAFPFPVPRLNHPAAYTPAARLPRDSAQSRHSACHKPAAGRADP
jgi:hypothetical protein